MLSESLRKSWSAKVVACGFIGIVLLGNFWLVYMFLGKHPPPLFVNTFFSCVGAVLLGGVGLLVQRLLVQIMPMPANPEDQDDEGYRQDQGPDQRYVPDKPDQPDKRDK